MRLSDYQVLTDGSVYQLKERGFETAVPYEERMEYIKLVQNAKMDEFEDQVFFFLCLFHVNYYYYAQSSIIIVRTTFCIFCMSIKTWYL